MNDENEKKPESHEEWGISIDLSNGEIEIFQVADKPNGWPFGLFVSLRTGTREQMISLRASMIANNLKTLRHGK